MWVELVVPGEIVMLFLPIESGRILRNGKYLGLVVFWLLFFLGFCSDVRCNYLIDIFELFKTSWQDIFQHSPYLSYMFLSYSPVIQRFNAQFTIRRDLLLPLGKKGKSANAMLVKSVDRTFEDLIWVFPKKIGVFPPKWMVYNEKTY